MKDLNLLKEEINEHVNDKFDIIEFDTIEDYLNYELYYKEEGKPIKYRIDIHNDMDREGFDMFLKDNLNFNKYDDEDLYDELYKYFKDKMKEMYYEIYEKAGYDNIRQDRSNEDVIYLIKY